MLILKIIVAFLICSLKYLVGIASLLMLNLGFFGSMIISVAGGMFGVVAFFYGNFYIKKLFSKPKDYSKLKINRMRRFMANMRRKKAIWLIAFLTPVLLQVPVGTIIAASFEKRFIRVGFPMFVSFMVYSVVIFGLFYLLDMQDSVIFKKLNISKH